MMGLSTKSFGARIIPIVIMGYLSIMPGRVEAADLKGVAGLGISSCALGGGGVLSAVPTSNSVQGIRYVFQDLHGKIVGEQWEIGRDIQPSDSYLIAGAESIERSNVHSMRCTFLMPEQFQPCGPELEVDEGPDIYLASIQITPTSISVRLVAFYNNFFSRGNYKLKDQLYFIQLDTHAPIEPLVTGVKSQAFVFRLSGVEAGRHKLSYGIISSDYSMPPHLEKLENCDYLNIPNGVDQDR
ncbi:MAG TPA: hypothetical protein VKT51_09070 [Candidatus Eremiobacteraceae bacterium]|nr:hypothetical protein [Candidatus Eremiobacteraceae bacterium]